MTVVSRDTRVTCWQMDRAVIKASSRGLTISPASFSWLRNLDPSHRFHTLLCQLFPLILQASRPPLPHIRRNDFFQWQSLTSQGQGLDMIQRGGNVTTSLKSKTLPGAQQRSQCSQDSPAKATGVEYQLGAGVGWGVPQISARSGSFHTAVGTWLPRCVGCCQSKEVLHSPYRVAGLGSRLDHVEMAGVGVTPPSLYPPDSELG